MELKRRIIELIAEQLLPDINRTLENAEISANEDVLNAIRNNILIVLEEML